MALVTPRGVPGALSLGPGQLFYSVLGSTEPTDLTTAWATVDTDWVMLGYTGDASEFKYQPATEDVEVAEELDPVATRSTGRTILVSFALAQNTATNLKRALNGGTITPSGGIVTYEPPDLGGEASCMIGFEAEDSQERWVFRECWQQGDLTLTRGKGAAKVLIPCEFKVNKPATGLKPFKVIYASANRA
jgi:hypothetical protein